MPLTEWNDAQQFSDSLASRESAIIFKHSTRCPVSAHALTEVEAFVQRHPDGPVHLVKVIESRPVSNAVADALSVTHQSPQAILVREGKAVWSASHGAVTADAVARAWTERMAAARKT